MPIFGGADVFCGLNEEWRFAWIGILRAIIASQSSMFIWPKVYRAKSDMVQE